MTRTLKTIKAEIEAAENEYREAYRDFHGEDAGDGDVLRYAALASYGQIEEAANSMVFADKDNVKGFEADKSNTRIAMIIYVLAENLVEMMTFKPNEGMGNTVARLFILEIERNLAIHYDYVRQPNEVL